ncbi:MAG: hypothetical protein K8R24_07445 [Mycobacterium sp.]|nr:hypothetical protein [Mycobacterium sp.]
MARGVTRLGAAAFALGISLAAPQAVASADTADDQGPPAAANPDSPSAGSGRAAARSTAAHPRRIRSDAAPTTAGTADLPAAAAIAQGPPATRSPGTPRARLNPRGGAESAARVATPTTAMTPAAALTEAGPDIAAPQPTSADTPSSDSGIAAESSVGVAMSTPAPGAPVVTIAVPVAAAVTTTADVSTNPLGPVESFIEGVVLLIRRTFFNQPPTVAPVQTTGQITGPITGTIGAVDPEGDPITYTVTSGPNFGTVEVSTDGTYLYTPGGTFAGLDTFTVAATDTGFHINLLDPFRPASTLANAVVEQGRAALVQFDFEYAGWALLWSPEARSALQTAATLLSSYVLVDTPVTVNYTVDGEFAPFSGQLASATSPMISSRAGFYPTVVQAKIISGSDVNGSTADGTITWNFANPWAFNGSASGGEYDFQSVAMHELMHTFGFLSTITEPGSNTDTTWTTYDQLLVTSDGTPVIGSDFIWNSAYDTNLTGGDGGLYSGGPAAVAAYGAPVPLYTPNPWQTGSSVSHLSDFVFVGRNKQLMIARVSTGTGIKTLSTIETGILTDLGYTTVNAPGGSAVLMMGLFIIRRRRTRATAG